MTATARIYALRLHQMRLRAIATRQRRDRDTALESTESELAHTGAALQELRESGGEARDERIAKVLALDETELDVLWSAVAATMDPMLNPHLRDLAGGEARHGISLALHALTAGIDADTARKLALALTSSHPLVRYGLIEGAGDSIHAARPLSVPVRIARYLAGDDTIDPDVLHVGGVVPIPVNPHFDEAQLACIKQLAQAIAAETPTIAVIEGPEDAGKRTIAGIVALLRRQRVLQIDASRIETAQELERSFAALRRECLLNDALPLVAHVDSFSASAAETSGRLHRLSSLLDETPVPAIVTSRTAGLDLGTRRPVLRMTMPVANTKARAVLWKRALGEAADADIEQLALRYRLGAGGVQRAVAAAQLLSSNGSPTTHDLVRGVRQGIAERLGDLAHRVDVQQSWDDLVLGPDTLDQVKGLVGRVRHGHLVYEKWGFNGKVARGRGTAALLSGPPGTGKTMVAGLIAADLDLELYQVDLSRVVSKWVGETEKQLAKIFDAAEAGHALLLFDEADALFAKRTEVKSANDRYANLEVNYLLQRIEAFGGISILTTNLDTSIDPALRRRLAAHIVFYAPDVDERALLWERHLPAEAPRGGSLDFEALATMFPDMTGANIRNAVLAAAFLAASEGFPIVQDHLERAGRGEYRAMGRVVR